MAASSLRNAVIFYFFFYVRRFHNLNSKGVVRSEETFANFACARRCIVHRDWNRISTEPAVAPFAEIIIRHVGIIGTVSLQRCTKFLIPYPISVYVTPRGRFFFYCALCNNFLISFGASHYILYATAVAKHDKTIVLNPFLEKKKKKWKTKCKYERYGFVAEGSLPRSHCTCGGNRIRDRFF